MQNVTASRQAKATGEIVSIADACLGGLRGRSALLVGPEKERQPFSRLLQQAGMKYLYEEDTPLRLSAILPHVQLLISIPAPEPPVQLLKAASIASGCIGRRSPLLIFDLSESTPSVEELVGLLPPVCLYTPEDLRLIFSRYF